MKGQTLILAVPLTMLLMGCMTTGKPISTDMVQTIIPGTSTRDDLLDKFGVPATIASRGEILTLSSPANRKKQFEIAVNRLNADTFFTLFPPADDHHRIYYFCYMVSYHYPVWYILYVGENGNTKTDRLWVLVDDKTGIVTDYAFKRYEKDTIFGRNRGLSGRQGNQLR